jgi:hypothetical protein
MNRGSKRTPSLLTTAVAVLAAAVCLAPVATAQSSDQKIKNGTTKALTTALSANAPAPPGYIKKWPKGKIRYFDASKDHVAVRAAAEIWNTSGLNIHFIEVKKKSKAQLIVENNARRVPDGCGSGLGSDGYQGKGRKAVISILHGKPEDGQPCAIPGKTIIMVHEMGHVLGLEHYNRSCSIMNSGNIAGVAPNECFGQHPTEEDYAPGRWMCHPLTDVDLSRVKKLYGGKPKPPPADPFCDLVPRMPTAGAFTVTDFGSHAAMQRLPEPAVPDYLAADDYETGYEYSYSILHSESPCGTPSTSATEIEYGAWQVAPGETQDISVFSGFSQGCFTLVAYDGLGRPSLTGTSTAALPAV